MSAVNKELACEFCTFLNVPNAKICDACGRTLGVPSVNLTSNGIECSQCTYQNPIGTATCHMCGGPIVANKKEDLSTTMMMDVGQLCQICTEEMIAEFKMPGCAHTFCETCAKRYFTIKIIECGINTFRCPIDGCVSFDELQDKSEFFKDLKRALRDIVDVKTINVFSDKVNILEIMDKPGFIRCSMCNHGYLHTTHFRKTTCPSCTKSFCSICGKRWTTAHLNVKCKPNEYGIGDTDDGCDLQMYTNCSCPQCKYKYFLERGGCMHITCSQCSYEYCEFCFTKITGKGKMCNFPNCTKGQSLHGHHPRNCMYYVQEMEHTRLEKLLKNNGIRYTAVQKYKATTCKVKINKENGAGWVDDECDKPSSKAYNYMCLNHYKWHLGELMKKHNIDPVQVMNNLECMCELKRNNVPLRVDRNSTFSQPIEDHETAGLRTMVQKHIPYVQIL